MIFLVLVVGFLSVSLAGEAPHCKPMPDFPDFDIHKFVGIWYQQAKYFDPLVAGVKCITSEYAFNSDELIVQNVGINTTAQAFVSLTAALRVPDPTKPSRFKLTFPSKPAIPPADYWIVSTDYNDYGIVYACNEVRGVFRTRVWLLTREPNPSQQLKTKLVEIAQRLEIETEPLIWTDQVDCENQPLEHWCEEAK